ncbi:MAG TPA: peptide chain release factor N(5)-glutamine methyltransferase [Pyrinomonadaceae bacterium]|nr:peptide chain release factor N(5)-glutamine methyltransferase [Pyrinomonadaceae bacterium]
MSVSIAEAIREAAQTLRQGSVPDARREAGSLLQHVIDRDRTFIITHAEDLMTPEEQQSFRECVARRAEGEPLQYITGRQAFFGLDFEVTKDVLIPRPETELLVETALPLVDEGPAAPCICDVGTGSGCIAVALLHENQRATAVGIDLSMEAIQVARRNAVRHSVAARISFLVADCLSALGTGPIFDLVVSNPPYVAGSALEGLQREVRDHEPRLALTPGVDGLTIIRRLLLDSGAFVKAGGHLLMEIGFDQGAAVERLIDRTSWKFLDIHMDLQGIPRIVALQKTTS